MSTNSPRSAYKPFHQPAVVTWSASTGSVTAMKVLLCLLGLGLVAGAASLGSEDLIDSLQQLLTNPEALGARARRDAGSWDRNYVMDFLGLSLRIKYTDPEQPMMGGRAHVKVPGKRFFRRASFDDVELDIDFNGEQIP